MKRSGDSRLVLVRRCTPGLILAVRLGLFLIAGESAVAQGNGTTPAASSLLPGAREDYVDSGGVRVHCMSLGREGSPLLVLIHGFPDFWYSWRAQMPALARDFHVVAIDQRGYNLSGQPEGVESYSIGKLVGDLLAVVKHFGPGKAVIVGHDWGGLVAWTFAVYHESADPELMPSAPCPGGTRPWDARPARPSTRWLRSSPRKTPIPSWSSGT